MTTAATSVSPDARRIWRSARGPVALAVLIVLLGIATALVRGVHEGGSLDPRSAHPAGSLAVARLLRDQGVRVEETQTVAGASAAVRPGGATLLITRPDWVAPHRLRELVRQADAAVLIGARSGSVRAIADRVLVSGESLAEVREPGCLLDEAVAAGPATLGGIEYGSKRDAEHCFRGTEGASLLRLTVAGKPVTLLGTGTPLTNAELDEEGNAALSLRLLGAHPRLVWYLPALDDPTLQGGQRSLLDLLPAGWKFGLLQVAVAVALFALWRARRLGPVVTEPLPVVVRAAETTEGRARLYRKARAADHAAEALRSAARNRIIAHLGLPAGAEQAAIVGSVAARCGRPEPAVAELLYGVSRIDDHGLVRLADALDTLENEVSTT